MIPAYHGLLCYVAEIALKKYKVILQKHSTGETNMYRSKKERQTHFRLKGGRPTKTNWFREKGGYTSTISVLPTPGSHLVNNIKEALAGCSTPKGTKPKIEEKGGRTVRQQLCRSDPYPRENCERSGCGMCEQKDSNSQCWKPNIGYRYDCNRCRIEMEIAAENGIPIESLSVYQYVGETSRTSFTRHQQHMSDYKTASKNRNVRTSPAEEGKDGSFMWTHTRDHHGGEVGQDNGITDYSLKVEGRFKDTLTRQVDEDVRLRESGWGLQDDLWLGCGKSGPKCVLLNGNGNYYKPKSVQTQFRQW